MLRCPDSGSRQSPPSPRYARVRSGIPGSRHSWGQVKASIGNPCAVEAEWHSLPWHAWHWPTDGPHREAARAVTWGTALGTHLRRNLTREQRVFVVIPVRNRRQLTLGCLACLVTQTYPALSIVIVDDGSSDGTAAAIRADYQGVEVLRGDGHLWWTGATNLGVQWCLQRASSSDYVLTLNDDTTMRPDYVARLVSTAQGAPGALIGSTLVDSRDGQTVLASGVRMRWLAAGAHNLGRGRSLAELQLASTLVHDVDLLSGRGTLIPVEVFRRIGLYDRRRLPHYAADYEFSHRAVRAGFRLCVDHGAVVFNVDNTGGRSAVEPHSTTRRVLWRLTSRKSPTNGWYHIVYARLVCPWYALPTYFVGYYVRLFAAAARRRMRCGSPTTLVS